MLTKGSKIPRRKTPNDGPMNTETLPIPSLTMSPATEAAIPTLRAQHPHSNVAPSKRYYQNETLISIEYVIENIPYIVKGRSAVMSQKHHFVTTMMAMWIITYLS